MERVDYRKGSKKCTHNIMLTENFFIRSALSSTLYSVTNKPLKLKKKKNNMYFLTLLEEQGKLKLGSVTQTNIRVEENP